MYLHLFIAPFHLLALIVLIAGEVRAYRSHRQIWRVVGLPLAFVLIPYLVNTGRLMLLLPFRDFLTVVLPLVAILWGAMQLLRNPATDNARSDGNEPLSESTTDTLAPSVKPASAQAVRILLFAGGLVGVVVCLIVLALLIINHMGYGGLKNWHLLIWGAAFVNYCFYAWVVWRNWSAKKLLLGGVIVHLHLFLWMPYLYGSDVALPVTAAVSFGLLTYAAHTWTVWQQETSTPVRPR